MIEPLDNLTADQLRRLYHDEGLTETEIAVRFGTYQVTINRLRIKWGIETIIKSDRLDLPAELTPRLTSILVGSMLGDGNLRRTGTYTAGYTEHHSEAQRGYLDWKASEWGPFFSTILPSNKGEHLGFRMYSHGCRMLFPYWQLFYPSGKGDKTFMNLDPSLVNDLALAVWFMDDGSKSGSYVRFSVGPDKDSQRTQLKVLRRFGLDVTLFGEGGDISIHVNGQTSITKFIDLVAPHIHPSLAYKLDLKVRKAGAAPRDLLTLDKVQPLVDRGLNASEISKVLNVPRSSVGRHLKRMGLPSKRTGRPRKEDRIEYSGPEASALLDKLDRGSERFLDEAVRILLRTSIPIPTPTREEIAHDIDLIRKSPTKLADDDFQHVSRAGSVICAAHFPYRWDAHYRDGPSVRLAWYDEKLVRLAVRFQLRVGDPVTPNRVLRALQVVVRGPTNFRASLAKAVVEVFCRSGGTVLDPCAGYGGRAVGTIAAGRKYIGVDPHPKASEAYAGLQADMGGDLIFLNSPFEDTDLSDVQVDLVFTSPPYFSVERYSDDSFQSWVRYKTWSSWVDRFLSPFVNKSWQYILPGGFFCVNTKNVRMGRNVYPIADVLQRLAVAVGFTLEKTLALPIGRVGKAARSEPLIVFKKPT